MRTTDEMDKLWDEARPARRDVLATGVAAGIVAGFHQLVQPVMAQTMIVTDATGLTQGMVKIKAADGVEVEAYRAMPAAGGARPLVLVIMEIFGVHEHIKDVCRRFAKLGYCAIAPELYQRQGDVAKLASIDEIRKIVGQVPDKQVLGDLDATVAWARAQGIADASRVGITGFCWGGRIVWLYAAHNPGLKAGVAWYGRLVGDKSANSPAHPVDVAKDIKAPVLGLYGAEDTGIPVATVEQMRAALGAGAKSSIHVYPGAPHAFHADYRPSFRKEAAEDGWKRCTEWFRANGV